MLCMFRETMDMETGLFEKEVRYSSLRHKEVADFVGKAATEALIEEVSTTPKPGLVDRGSSGAHKDMDYRTFLDSAAAISFYLYKMADIGSGWNKDLKDLFQAIRVVGMEAEAAMFQATKGVNTHKGLIFSAGILAAASAYVYKKTGKFDTDGIFRVSAEMTYDALESDFRKIDRSNPRTNGEKLYVKYGNRGIRGEVQSGFQSVKTISLPLMRSLKKRGVDGNLANIQVLFNLMASLDDTNILSRHDDEMLRYVKKTAQDVLNLGGIFTSEGMDRITRLDGEFIEKNISSGGCADLLAVTIMMNKLES